VSLIALPHGVTSTFTRSISSEQIGVSLAQGGGLTYAARAALQSRRAGLASYTKVIQGIVETPVAVKHGSTQQIDEINFMA